MLLGATAAAAASDRWSVAAIGAVAFAPIPVDARGVDALQLDCREQRWTMLLRTNGDFAAPDPLGAAALRIDRSDFELEPTLSPRGIELRVPRDLLDPLKSGGAMTVSLGDGETRAFARLSLRGSRNAIEAIAPLCTPRDMSAYELVALEDAGEAVDTGRELLAAEIRRFKQFAGQEPEIRAGLLEFPGERRLLVASLCGASSYFGDTGCNVTVHASSTYAPEWREVYNTEGVAIHLDRASFSGGWPRLVTLPPGEDEEFVWSWDGETYALLSPE
ncbi:hypothetical protein FQ775_06565 [Nitratireductor mangrovi]|uniref:Uncharacterized protein n=1 Tax=Nitratireductor mangrovi TaxID=2599600 RepID=A0A5B8KWZ2_9HYPH|nr:hypothetical protein [Nitratireductor mangrovi]QDZ00069.1 hypothetical protein FQ775_06565 [Nitratireductor mangrovi]